MTARGLRSNYSVRHSRGLASRAWPKPVIFQFFREVPRDPAAFPDANVHPTGTCYYEPADVIDIGHQVSQVNVNVFS